MTGAPGRPSRIETVLLDAGGVLLDLDYAFLGRLLEIRGHAVRVSDLARAEAVSRAAVDRRVREGGTTADGWRDYFRILLREAGTPVEIRETIIDILWEAHESVGLWTVPAAGAPEIVRQLKDLGFRLGVVSNAEGNVQRDLDVAGYDGMFGTVVDSHLVGVEKPDPAIFRIALERLHSDPRTAVHVGDVPAIDVEGSRAAGIAPVLLDRFDLYPSLGVARLRSIAELPGWLADA